MLDKVLQMEGLKIVKAINKSVNVKNVDDEETKCFFLKMYANYYRNSAENKKRGGL